MYTVNTTKHVLAIFAEFNLVLNMNHFSLPKQINEFFSLLHGAITFMAPVCIKKTKKLQLWALLSSAPVTSAQGDMPAHKSTFISPFLCVCFFFLVVERATSSQRTALEGQVRLDRRLFMCSADAVCSLILTSSGVGQQMERQLTYGTKSLSSWSEQES